MHLHLHYTTKSVIIKSSNDQVPSGESNPYGYDGASCPVRNGEIIWEHYPAWSQSLQWLQKALAQQVLFGVCGTQEKSPTDMPDFFFESQYV
jgi:hypothetical protein